MFKVRVMYVGGRGLFFIVTWLVKGSLMYQVRDGLSR